MKIALPLSIYRNRGIKKRRGSRPIIIVGKYNDFDILHRLVHNKKLWNYSDHNGRRQYTMNWRLKDSGFCTIEIWFFDFIHITPSLADDARALKDFVETVCMDVDVKRIIYKDEDVKKYIEEQRE